MNAIPAGKGMVTPYVVVKGAAGFSDFVREVFGGEELLRLPNEDGTIGHAEIRVGDTIILTFDARPEWPETPAFLSVYVEDANEVYARALAAGARGVTEPFTSKVTGDRMSRVADPYGNVWWVQTHLEDPTQEQIIAAFADLEERTKMVYLQNSLDEEMRSRV